MISNKYKYGLIDGRYILTRALFATVNYERSPEATASDVVRSVIYTLRKLSRDYGVTTDKLIFLWDKWDPKYSGYYRTFLLKGLYKDDREYITDEDVEKEDDPEVKKQLEFKAYQNKVKYEAKTILQNELGKFGVPSFMRLGYEGDDLAAISANYLYNDNKPSILITKDGDWSFFLNPKVDYFRIPLKGKDPEIITFSSMINEVPEELRSRVSLYDWKALYDSIEGSHNAMRKTRFDRVNTKDIIKNIILNEDYSGIEDYETFRKQYDSFLINKFPDFDKVCNMIYYYDKSGRCGSLDEFKEFDKKYNIGISDKYYTGYIDTFDTRLYSD
jgi:hypothetical protein